MTIVECEARFYDFSKHATSILLAKYDQFLCFIRD